MNSSTTSPSQAAHTADHSPRPRPRQRHQRGPGRTQIQSEQDAGLSPSKNDHGLPARDPALALRPASLAPRSKTPPTDPSSTELRAAENSGPTSRMARPPRGRGVRYGSTPGDRGQGRDGGARGGLHYNGSTLLNDFGVGHIPSQNARQFGGRLTTNENTTPTTVLQPDAPEFRPGQPHQSRSLHNRTRRGVAPATSNSVQQPIPRMRRGSSPKSTAPDIATRTHEDIANSVYECPICTADITRNSKVWSCKTCWTVFHLGCIKKWSENEGSTLASRQPENADLPPPRQWRCPGCNLPKDNLPSAYACWCEKELDPRPMYGIPPHSCGQTCGKHRMLPRKCPHPCELLCHAGPCPPCSHMGPVQSCFCGKKSTSRRCVDTNYDTGWSCGEICGDLMPCGEHTCKRFCHEGLCGACEVRIDARCYCGKDAKPIICCERGDEMVSEMVSHDEKGDKSVDTWTGIFDCGSLCQRFFDCGKHKCEQQCHPQDAEPSHCPRSPDIVRNCPCGKTPLTEISHETRTSCENPIPNCQKRCLKRLSCGHPCQQVCHSGACAPCHETVVISCKCGRTTSPTICHQGTEEPPQCMRVCKVTLNCGRHECGERCCQGERKATERLLLKRKLRPLGATPRFLDEGFEAEHICTRLCGRDLKCGNHACAELCHKGPCNSCREAIFEDISCHCGRTVLQPPLPCGTGPPPCRYDCNRSKDCGHPQVPHNCHGDDESCPKCPFLMEKPCMCEKKTLKNQPCWLADVRCGETCGRKLKCGSHFCRKQCHRSGGCEDAGKSCQQLCGKAKKSCGHPCEEICHAPSSCREDKPCQNRMLITCDCQHLKTEVRCNATKTGEGNSKKTLKCDDECARLERNRKLALALNIDPATHKDDHIPYSASTLQMFKESTKWAQTQEGEFRVFAADETEKRLRFKPMPSHQRAFIHSLAEDFGLDSESTDPEPHRHVFVFKTPRFVMAPMKTLMECLRIKNAAAETTGTLSFSEAQKKAASNEPFNGFLLTGPRFALTLEELRHDLQPSFDTMPTLIFTISFLPNEEIVIKAHPAAHSNHVPASSIETWLRSLKASLVSIITTNQLASSVYLCTLDNSLNIQRREADGAGASDGWSQVAAKAAVGPRAVPRQQAVGSKSSFTVLGSKLKDAKKRKEEKEKEKVEMGEVVDDWEEAVRKEEEKEKESDLKIAEQSSTTMGAAENAGTWALHESNEVGTVPAGETMEPDSKSEARDNGPAPPDVDSIGHEPKPLDAEK